MYGDGKSATPLFERLFPWRAAMLRCGSAERRRAGASGKTGKVPYRSEKPVSDNVTYWDLAHTVETHLARTLCYEYSGSR